MGKLNLRDAAKAVLTEGAKETFDANISAKKGMRGQDAHKKGAVGQDKLTGKDAYDTKEVGVVGHSPEEIDDQNPDYTKGTPKATPPGATPPVGSQPEQHLDSKFDQQAHGRKELETPVQHPSTDYSSIRDRVKAKLAGQTFHANPGAVAPYVPEEAHVEGEVVAEDKDEKHEDEAEDKKLIKKMLKKEKMKEEMQSDVDALLSGENLSEEFKEKATTIFEAAVVARTHSIVEQIEEALFEEFESSVNQIKEELSTKLDDYIDYMAEEWFKENQLAIEKGLRSEIVEDFINGLRDLFTEHYIDIPEEKVNVVEELTNKVEELESSLNEQIASAVEMKKELNEHKKTEAIHAVCEGLTQTQVEKMKSLAEGVDFTTDEEFADKLVTLRQSYFSAAVKSADSSALNEEVQIEEEKKETVSSDPLMSVYAKTISKSLAK